MLSEVLEGAERAVAAEGHRWPGVKGAVARAQLGECVVRVRVCIGDVGRAWGSEGAVVSAQVKLLMSRHGTQKVLEWNYTPHRVL